MTRAVLPDISARKQRLLAGLSWTEPPATGPEHPPLGEGDDEDAGHRDGHHITRR